jgi:hypothetical protein
LKHRQVAFGQPPVRAGNYHHFTGNEAAAISSIWKEIITDSEIAGASNMNTMFLIQMIGRIRVAI